MSLDESKELSVRASRMTGTGILVAASATAMMVGLNAGSSAVPPAAAQRSFASIASMSTTRTAAVSASSARIHTFVAGRPRQVIGSGQAIWTVDVKPGLYDVSFKAILALTQPDATHPGQVICGALDLQTFAQTQSGVPWIYTVDSAEYWGQLPAAMSGSATVPVRPGARPGVLCFSSTGGYQLVAPIVVTFTKVKSRHISRAHGVPLNPKQERSIMRLFRP
jgi:hypothetical protein